MTISIFPGEEARTIKAPYNTRRTIAAGTIGNILEWFDFSIYVNGWRRAPTLV
jgi:hypothetical protein